MTLKQSNYWIVHTFDTYYYAPPVTETTCYTEYKTVSTVLCQIDQGPPLCLAHFMLNQARHSPTKISCSVATKVRNNA